MYAIRSYYVGWELQRTCPSHIQLQSFGSQDVDFSNVKGLEHCIEKSDAQWIINAAAYTAVDKAEKEENQADQLNHLAVAQIAETVITSYSIHYTKLYENCLVYKVDCLNETILKKFFLKLIMKLSIIVWMNCEKNP